MESHARKRGPKFRFSESTRKLRKAEQNKKRGKCRISIGPEQFERWETVKDSLKLTSHIQVAKVLLDV